MSEQAVTAFVAEVAYCYNVIERIKEHLDNHLGKDPDNIDFAAVGDATRLSSDLEAIEQYLPHVTEIIPSLTEGLP